MTRLGNNSSGRVQFIQMDFLKSEFAMRSLGLVWLSPAGWLDAMLVVELFSIWIIQGRGGILWGFPLEKRDRVLILGHWAFSFAFIKTATLLLMQAGLRNCNLPISYLFAFLFVHLLNSSGNCRSIIVLKFYIGRFFWKKCLIGSLWISCHIVRGLSMLLKTPRTCTCLFCTHLWGFEPGPLR